MQLGLAWSALEIASASVRSGDCLSAFVYLVKGSNSWVGYVQGINGIMQACTVVPNSACQVDETYRALPTLRQPMPSASDLATLTMVLLLRRC